MFPTAVKPLEQLNPIDTWHNRILMMSRLTSFKGTGLAVEAVAIAAKQLGRKLTLRMAGDGPLKHQIRRDAERFNVPTEFLGQLLPQEIHRAIVDVDALLFPSLGPESFGLAGIEAGCFGVPAVGFPVGGISEWLVDGKTGVMANAEFLDANSLGQALAKCLENWEKFQYLRTNALETAKKFSTEAHLAQLIEIFTEVIDEFKTKRD
jgi:glycogen(starch) synthase